MVKPLTVGFVSPYSTLLSVNMMVGTVACLKLMTLYVLLCQVQLVIVMRTQLDIPLLLKV
jgi:hypothetical protein